MLVLLYLIAYLDKTNIGKLSELTTAMGNVYNL